jgi:5'-3' exonuclease
MLVRNQFVEEDFIVNTKPPEVMTDYDVMDLCEMTSIPRVCVESSHSLVKEYYGVSPEGVPDLKGLMGDSSDSIPGIAGIGEY